MFKNIISKYKTVLLNFYYFPFKTAIRFPIACSHNVSLDRMRGSIELDTKEVRKGMIKLGFQVIGVYDKSLKSIWKIDGKIIVKGKLELGSGFALRVEKDGTIEFGDNLVFGAVVKIICVNSIIIGKNTRFAWEIIMTDTNFHYLKSKTTGDRNEMTKPVIIGENNWIGLRCVILKGTETPNFCTFGASSVLNKKYKIQEYSVMAGNPASLKSEGWYRDLSY